MHQLQRHCMVQEEKLRREDTYTLLSDNILFKTFAKSISEELVSLSSVDAAIF